MTWCSGLDFSCLRPTGLPIQACERSTPLVIFSLKTWQEPGSIKKSKFIYYIDALNCEIKHTHIQIKLSQFAVITCMPWDEVMVLVRFGCCACLLFSGEGFSVHRSRTGLSILFCNRWGIPVCLDAPRCCEYLKLPECACLSSSTLSFPQHVPRAYTCIA